MTWAALPFLTQTLTHQANTDAHAHAHTNLNSVLKIAKTNLLDMKPFSTSLSFKLSRGSMYFFSFSWKREWEEIKFDRGTQSKIWHHRKATLVLIARDNRDWSRFIWGPKIKSCLVVNTSPPTPALKREAPGDGRARRGGLVDYCISRASKLYRALA